MKQLWWGSAYKRLGTPVPGYNWLFLSIYDLPTYLLWWGARVSL